MESTASHHQAHKHYNTVNTVWVMELHREGIQSDDRN